MSPLEEASRDPVQNCGFKITWKNLNQTTRISSYAVMNEATPSIDSSLETVRSTDNKAAPKMSRILSDVKSPPLGLETSFAAFKALPVDPARLRSDNLEPTEPAVNELVDAKTCQEKVNIAVNIITSACNVARGFPELEFVVDEDIVSLAEAQKATTTMMKIEYGLKRLLWLGAG